MVRNFRNICVTVFLCIVILCITGFAFPKYISYQILKKRAIFNSTVASLKLISKEHLVSNQMNVENSTNSSNFVSKETGSPPRSSFRRNIAFHRLETPVKGKRLKRHTTSQNDSNDLFSWNFNLNVTRLEKTALKNVTKKDSETVDDQHLGVAVYISSPRAQKTALSELQRTLDSLTSFLKNIFGSGSENGTYDFQVGNKGEIKHPDKKSEGENLDMDATQDFSSTEKGLEPETIYKNRISQSFQEISPVSELEATQFSNTEKFDSGSRNESVKKGREGRIFFNILQFGGKLLGKTSSVSETEATKKSMDVTQTETNIFRDENLPIHPLQQKSEWATENSNQKANFHSDSLESSVSLSTKASTNDLNTENLPFQQTTQLLECPSCVTGGLGFSNILNKVEEKSDGVMLKKTDSTETLFTDEILNFCNNLPKDLGESHPSLLAKEESESEATIAEDSFLINIEATTELSVQTDKQSRFFSLFDSGSGRSGITSDEKDLTLGQVDEFTKFTSVLDCLTFFSKKQNTKIILKPNDIDINDPENKIFSNFENASVVPNLDELKFSNLNSSVQTFDEISESTETDLGISKTPLGDENFAVKDLSEKQEKINTESNDFDLGNKLDILESADAGNGAENTSDDRRDGKFLNFFDLGSGRDVQGNTSTFERFFNTFFSSGERSLEDSGGLEESINTVDLGSDDSFIGIEGFSGDGTMLSFSDNPPEDFSITSGQDPRFLSLLGFAGSGNGRELTEDSELIVTELSDNVDNECGNNCSYGDTKQFHKCDDYECNFGNIHDEENIDSTESETLIHFNESNCHGECYPKGELLNRDNSSISTNESSNYSGKNITGYFPEIPEKCNCFRGNNFTEENEAFPECDCSSDTLQASDVPYIDPGNNYEKFDDKQVLVTPSLLETSKLNYQINIDGTDTYQEIESPHLDEVNIRDLHASTTLSVESINTAESLHQEQTTVMKSRRFVGTIFLTGSGDGGLFGDNSGPINLVEEERTINPVVQSRRRGRLDDVSIDSCDDCRDLSELIQQGDLEMPQTNHFSSSSTIKLDDNVPVSPITRPQSEATTLKDSMTNTENITFRSVIVSNEPSTSSNAPPDLQFRPCAGARDCNVTLNERCIKINSSSVCECGRTFVRQKLTRKCLAKRHIETTLKLPAEMFDSELRNPYSATYKSMSEKSVDTMWLLLNETPDIPPIVAEVNVAKFSAGSLIISLYLVIAVENESEAESIKDLEGKLQKALGNENLMKRASLNITNATVLSVTDELNPCKSAELNQCSRNAYCKWKEDNQTSYTCYCKEHFLDVSSDPLFPGEKCIDKCPTSYCGLNGHCEVIDNERHCLCNGMYFGERCEVPGMVILCSLTVTALISLLVLCAVIIKLRCRKTSYGGSPTFRRSEDIGPHTIAAGRVSDAIALVENPGAKVSKFSQISTPVPMPPRIKVTQPTLNDSSISYEFDSSFDPSTSGRAESTGN